MKHHHGHSFHLVANARTDATHLPPHDEIARCAREIWIQRGRPENHDEAIWLEAEARLQAERQGSARTQPAGLSAE